MRDKPNIESFLHGGKLDKIARGDDDDKMRKEQKVFRLPVDVIEAVRAHSFSLSEKEQKRVTEVEIVERALRKYLKV